MAAIMALASRDFTTTGAFRGVYHHRHAGYAPDRLGRTLYQIFHGVAAPRVLAVRSRCGSDVTVPCRRVFPRLLSHGGRPRGVRPRSRNYRFSPPIRGVTQGYTSCLQNLSYRRRLRDRVATMISLGCTMRRSRLSIEVRRSSLISQNVRFCIKTPLRSSAA